MRDDDFEPLIPRIHFAVAAWHRGHGRDVALRRSKDPWHLLVFEVASQQTQLLRATEGALAFCARFPTPGSLAEASPAEAVRAWAGLGYNRRAVGLHRAAVAIVRDHGGELPRSIAELEALPGVGPYTARAVAAQALAEPVGPLDVNVRRLLGRLVPELASDRRRLQTLADRLAGVGDPAAWMHAVIDLAALVCTARSPLCADCPIAAACPSAFRAFQVPEANPAAASSRVPFPSTRRWLRGQLVRELRDLPEGEWTHLGGSRGEHGEHDELAVHEALAGLARDGLVEIDQARGVRLAEA